MTDQPNRRPHLTMPPRGSRLAGAVGVAVVAAAMLAAATGARAQAGDDFYKGKTVSIIVYTPTGSSYDIVGRAIAHYIPNYLPGQPTTIVRNMPGAGGLTATRYLYATAPKDGTVFGTVSRGIPFEPLFGGAGSVDFDPLKFTWLGSPSRESSLAISWHTAAVKTARDLLTTELLVAGTGASADSETVPRALNGLIGTKFKIISGYEGLTRATLSIERGEIEGMAYFSWGALKSSKPDWLRDKKINLLFQTAPVPHPEIPDVPTVMSLATNDAQRQALALLFARDIVAYPFVAPPDLPPARAAALKRAFADVLKDAALIEGARKAGLAIDPLNAEEAEAIVRRAFATDPAVIERTRKAMGR